MIANPGPLTPRAPLAHRFCRQALTAAALGLALAVAPATMAAADPSFSSSRITASTMTGTVTGASNPSAYRVVLYVHTPGMAPHQYRLVRVKGGPTYALKAGGKVSIPYAKTVGNRVATSFAAFIIPASKNDLPDSLWLSDNGSTAASFNLPDAVGWSGLLSR
ncbi:MAG: hypothetical protein U0625_10695 [Phycisphaerales bacterium]